MKTVLHLAVLCFVLSACASEMVGTPFDKNQQDPDFTASDARCKHFASEYVRNNRGQIDPLWREQEYYQQYRICMSKAVKTAVE